MVMDSEKKTNKPHIIILHIALLNQGCFLEEKSDFLSSCHEIVQVLLQKGRFCLVHHQSLEAVKEMANSQLFPIHQHTKLITSPFQLFSHFQFPPQF